MSVIRTLVLTLFILLFLVIPSIGLGLFWIIGMVLAILTSIGGAFATLLALILLPLLNIQPWIAITAIAGTFLFSVSSFCFLIVMTILAWLLLKLIWNCGLYLVKTDLG